MNIAPTRSMSARPTRAQFMPPTMIKSMRKLSAFTRDLLLDTACTGDSKGRHLQTVITSSSQALWSPAVHDLLVDDFFRSFRWVFACRRFGLRDRFFLRNAIGLVPPCGVPMIEMTSLGAPLFFPQRICFCVSVRFIAHVLPHRNYPVGEGDGAFPDRRCSVNGCYRRRSTGHPSCLLQRHARGRSRSFPPKLAALAGDVALLVIVHRREAAFGSVAT